MFSVFECVTGQHDLRLVLLAAIVSVFSNFSLFFTLTRACECGVRRRRQWLAVASIVGGVGVWATHFIAMLAYRGPTPIGYGISLTVASIGVGIAFFWLALLVPLHHPASSRRWAVAGIVATVATGAMHMTGMTAIIAPVRVQYDVPGLLLAVASSAVFLTLSFFAFARLAGRLRLLVPTVLAVAGVCTLHFMEMTATVLIPDPTLATGLEPPGHAWLSAAIVAATSVLAMLTGVAAAVDRSFTDLRGLADASLEGLAIIQNDRIVDANRFLAEMLGVGAETLKGTAPDRWMVAADGQCVAARRAKSVEARPRARSGPEQVLEIATHAIEYRGRDCIVLAVRDLTEKKAAQKRIEHMARHDALTDLPNRALLDERIQAALSGAQDSGQSVALLALDLDRFKAINDIFGHPAGDAVLQQVTEILRSNVRESETVARIGGDEFMILQVGASQPEGARSLAQRILADFARDMDRARNPMAVGTSIGIAIYPDDAGTCTGLKHAADVALYQAKSLGRGTASFFDKEMDRALQERRALERDLRQAIAARQMQVVYQPLVDTADGSISGYEALLRWSHPQRGEISPELFVPIAEESGAIMQLGEWALREACRAAAGWPDHVSVAVNISPMQFQLPNIVNAIAGILQEAGLRPERLELEITETVLVRDRRSALDTLRRLKSLGVRIVMDDFGTGYSSLSNLQNFPIDKIKIDRSFVTSIEDDMAARSIVRAIVGIGKNLTIPVVAEGVETEEQRRMIVEEGCTQAQGYLFGYPGALPELGGAARPAIIAA